MVMARRKGIQAMTQSSPSHLLELLNSCRPLNELHVIRKISEFKWARYDGMEMGILCDLILRLNAEVIVCSHMKDEREAKRYFKLFRIIENNIRESEIANYSNEFSKYYMKFISYTKEFEQNFRID